MTLSEFLTRTFMSNFLLSVFYLSRGVHPQTAMTQPFPLSSLSLLSPALPSLLNGDSGRGRTSGKIFGIKDARR